MCDKISIADNFGIRMNVPNLGGVYIFGTVKWIFKFNMFYMLSYFIYVFIFRFLFIDFLSTDINRCITSIRFGGQCVRTSFHKLL